MLLLVGAFALGWGREVVDAKQARTLMLWAHGWLGLGVAAVLLARLMARALAPVAPLADANPWTRWLARGVQVALYGAMLALPLVGLLLLNAKGKALPLPGGIPLPVVTGADEDFEILLEPWHAWGAWFLLALIALHVAGAVWHHVFRRDAALRRITAFFDHSSNFPS